MQDTRTKAFDAMQNADVLVIGGGMFGAAVGYGLARRGLRVTMLDEGDNAFRAARGNFGLVWYQGKGKGMQRYADWTLESIRLWPDFAAELDSETGVNVGYHKPGGLTIATSEKALNARKERIELLRRQAGNKGYDCEFIDRDQVQALFPEIELGPNVIGGSFSPHDGHANPLKLLRALHAGFAWHGGRYLPDQQAVRIERRGRDFVVTTPKDVFGAAKVVIAAGHGVTRLADMVDIRVPLRPERGQLLVTERTRQVLPVPMSGVRQNDEGTVMLGVSNEEVGFDDSTTLDQTQRIARLAIEKFPALRHLRLVRTWGALRILTPDGYPVYAESKTQPGAYALACHSAVTLSAVNANAISYWIAEGVEPEDFDTFRPERFDA
jgi:glycine/D-amino acid oxidase-like deaminating enzyme